MSNTNTMKTISSTSNPKIKSVSELRDSRTRRKRSQFLIDGVREIERAVWGGIKLLEVYITKEFKKQNTLFLAKITGDADCYLIESDATFEKLTFGNRSDGIVVVAETPSNTFFDFQAKIRKSTEKRPPLIAVLEKIEKPGNIGAVFRSADGAGLDGIIICDGLCELYNPNVIRSSLGTIFHIPVTEMSATDAIRWLQETGIKILTAVCDAKTCYTNCDLRKPTAIVLGSESTGLSEHWVGENFTQISIPMLGIADSLNISNAAAVLFYEAQRQRVREI